MLVKTHVIDRAAAIGPPRSCSYDVGTIARALRRCDKRGSM
jgi:hypothetical protein